MNAQEVEKLHIAMLAAELELVKNPTEENRVAADEAASWWSYYYYYLRLTA